MAVIPMDNSTEPMIFQQEKDEFEHPFHMKVSISILSVLIILSMLFVNRRLSKFFRRPDRRFLDQIIHFQMSVQIIAVVLSFIFFNIVIWAKIPKFFVTKLGCYIGTYIFNFVATYMGAHSFFIALFRYICIMHPDRLSNLNISPQVR